MAGIIVNEWVIFDGEQGGWTWSSFYKNFKNCIFDNFNQMCPPLHHIKALSFAFLLNYLRVLNNTWKFILNTDSSENAILIWLVQWAMENFHYLFGGSLRIIFHVYYSFFFVHEQMNAIRKKIEALSSFFVELKKNWIAFFRAQLFGFIK